MDHHLRTQLKIQYIYKMIYKNPNFKPMNLGEGELVKLLVNCYVASKISFTNFVKNITENIQFFVINNCIRCGRN